MDNDWKKRLGMVYSTNPDFQFETGEEITYWIVAYDTANNSVQSNEKSFMIN